MIPPVDLFSSPSNPGASPPHLLLPLLLLPPAAATTFGFNWLLIPPQDSKKRGLICNYFFFCPLSFLFPIDLRFLFFLFPNLRDFPRKPPPPTRIKKGSFSSALHHFTPPPPQAISK